MAEGEEEVPVLGVSGEKIGSTMGLLPSATHEDAFTVIEALAWMGDERSSRVDDRWCSQPSVFYANTADRKQPPLALLIQSNGVHLCLIEV